MPDAPASRKMSPDPVETLDSIRLISSQIQGTGEESSSSAVFSPEEPELSSSNFDQRHRDENGRRV